MNPAGRVRCNTMPIANTPASPSLGQGIEPLQIMVNAKELATVEYVDYTFVFAD